MLQKALAEDAASKGQTKGEARRRAEQALQNLLGYLKEHSNETKAAAPEHVIVYDEAQRAWDEETGLKLLGRRKSEPALFLQIMARLSWSCRVCLIGPGQEINRGEGGLALWGAALRQAIDDGLEWEVHASPIALRSNEALVGAGLLDGLEDIQFPIKEEPLLHLAVGVRAYRNELYDDWIRALLGGQIIDAAVIASRMTSQPAMITRSLRSLKDWLRARNRGTRRAGLLSNALEVPLSEFVCQGLEIDDVGLCWGGDLIWQNKQWVPRTMRAPRWQIIRDPDKQTFKLNAYRVLMTRARVSTAIYVPEGCSSDPTRAPSEFDSTWDILKAAGCACLQG